MTRRLGTGVGTTLDRTGGFSVEEGTSSPVPNLSSTIQFVAVLRMFASAREAAGTGREEIDGANVGEVLAIAGTRYGRTFVDVLATCRIWVNGDDADESTPVTARDGKRHRSAVTVTR
jgi:molybdopterin synthase sulfur carrier subunit